MRRRLLLVRGIGGIGLVAGALLLGLPLVALLIRVPPTELVTRLGQPLVLEALRLSLVTSAAAVACCVVGGLPLAWMLARGPWPGRRALEVLVDLPMVIPPTVAGLALLLAFGRAGLAGSALTGLGLSLPFTTLGVVVAQTFMAFPFFVNAATAGFRTVDPRLLDAAATLRAPPVLQFVRVVLPLAWPALAAAAAMSWARALGEFGATITFAGNLPGVTQTMPLAVYLALQSDFDAAVALSVLLVVVAVVLLVGLKLTLGSWSRAAGSSR